MCRQLADQRDHRLEIDVVSRVDIALRESALSGGLPGTTLRHIAGDATSPGVLAGLDPAAYDCVALMGSESSEDRFEPDSRTITKALVLLHLLHEASARPHMIAEVLEPANRTVIEDRGIELVVAPELMARMLAGAVVHPGLAGVFESMVQGSLGRLAVVPLKGFATDGETTFGEIERCFRQQGTVCLGLQREARGYVPELAPDKREPLRLGVHDRGLVVETRPARVRSGGPAP